MRGEHGVGMGVLDRPKTKRGNKRKKKGTPTLKSAWIIEESGGRTPSSNADAFERTPKANSRSSTKVSVAQETDSVNRKNLLSEKISDTAYFSAVEHTVGTGVLDRPNTKRGSAKKNAPKSGRYLLISFGDQITRTRRTASRAVRSASTVAGTAPVTSKMV